MKTRGLLAAVIVLLALTGGIYWSNYKQKTAAAKPTTDAAPKILTIPEDQIKEVRLKKTGADTTVLRRGGDGKWQIVEPQPLHADQDAANSLVSTLSNLNADKLVEDKAADLSAYGLNSPTLDVTVLKKDGKAQDFYLGDDTPTGSGSYAKLAGDAHVYTVASFVKTSLEKTSNDLRDKRLLTFDQDKLTRIDLQRANGEPIEFGKNNQNAWQILKPKPLRADGSQVEDLIRKLKDAKMDASVSAETPRTTRTHSPRGPKSRLPRWPTRAALSNWTSARSSTIKTRPITRRAARWTESTKSRPTSATGSARNWTISATRSCSTLALRTLARCRQAKPPTTKSEKSG